VFEGPLFEEILAANSLIIQLHKLWILYYIPTHYSSVLFTSLHSF